MGGYFLLIDLLAGRPFWTPAALGAALFLGERLAPDADPNPALVFAYSLLHVAVFVGIAGLAAVNLANRKFPLTPRRWMGLLALILWAGFQVGFAVLAVLAGGWLWSELGWLHISVANLLAASLMAVVLVIVAPRHSSVPATLPR